MRHAWTVTAAAAVGMLAAYLVFALLLGETALGAGVRLRHAYLAAFAAAAALVGLRSRGRLSDRALRRVTLLAGSTVLVLLVLDTAVAWRENRRALADLEEELGDPTLGARGLRAPVFYPTAASFAVHKPGFRASGERYGDLYTSTYRRSPTLVRQVLERRRVSLSIDAEGFRETAPLPAARIFALGDSYTYGPTIDGSGTWPAILASLLAEPVYNLGIDDASPATEYLLLDHVLRSKPANVRHVLWMLFEGNDLDDSWARPARGAPPDPLRETVFGALAISVPHIVNEQSVLGRIRRGALHRAAAAGGVSQIDGIELEVPLHRSDRLGYFFVYPPYLAEARRTESSVLRHPGRARLDATFADMKALASARGFEVTVLVAPSLPRLYAAELPGAGVSERAHFADHVLTLGRHLGFKTVNLVDDMRPYAAREMLYFRDDSHWNERGNRVAAEIIARRVFAR